MCEICKSKTQKTFSNTIHLKKLEPIVLRLCFAHDLELFKRGQEFFLLKYKYELAFVMKGSIPLGQNDDLSDLNFT